MQFYDERLGAELSADEKLVWSGKPRTDLVLRPLDVLLVPFSLMWGGFALFWELSIVATNAPFFMKLWGIPFLAIGVYVTIGRFFHDRWRRRGTFYALTPRRAIIFTRSGTKSIRLGDGLDLQYKPGQDGRATIQFGADAPLFSFGNAAGFGLWSGTPTVPSFEGVTDGARVYADIKRLAGL